MKQIVIACKHHKWIQYALQKLPPAYYYAKFEDDHFLNLRLLSFELNQLRRYQYLYYSMIMWGEILSPEYDESTIQVSDRDAWYEFVNKERFCYQGSGCTRSFENCPMEFVHSYKTLNMKNCIGNHMVNNSYKTKILFGAGADIRSRDLATKISSCVFANNYIKFRSKIYEKADKYKNDGGEGPNQ